MVTYTDYKTTVDTIHKTVMGDVYELAAAQFEAEEGVKPRQVLPDRTTTDQVFSFSHSGISGDLYPHEREIYNIEVNGKMLTENRLSTSPMEFSNIGTLLYEAWSDLIGEPNPKRSPPGVDPGPSMEKGTIEEVLSNLENQRQLLMADPTLDDFIAMVKDKNYSFAGRLLNIDAPDLLAPSGGHEMASLFTNGEIHIIYRDSDIAILKPEYNHDLREEILNQQTPGWQRVSFRGEIPEPGFVVGRDDTPVGLFAHIVDATRLSYTQDVSRDYIHTVMGFDRSIEEDEIILDLEEGACVRLQGDLAVECLEKTHTISHEEARCNIPIDNHLVMLKNATLPEGESREQEPITVEIPERTPLNVNHDEHEPVSTGIMPGRYQFYLLPRGLQPASERPEWPEP